MQFRFYKSLALVIFTLFYSPLASSAPDSLPEAIFKSRLAAGTIEVRTQANPPQAILRLFSDSNELKIEKLKILKNNGDQLILQASEKISNAHQTWEGLQIDLNRATQTVEAVKAKKWSWSEKYPVTENGESKPTSAQKHETVLLNPFLKIQASSADSALTSANFTAQSLQALDSPSSKTPHFLVKDIKLDLKLQESGDRFLWDFAFDLGSVKFEDSYAYGEKKSEYSSKTLFDLGPLSLAMKGSGKNPPLDQIEKLRQNLKIRTQELSENLGREAFRDPWTLIFNPSLGILDQIDPLLEKVDLSWQGGKYSRSSSSKKTETIQILPLKYSENIQQSANQFVAKMEIQWKGLSFQDEKTQVAFKPVNIQATATYQTTYAQYLKARLAALGQRALLGRGMPGMFPFIFGDFWGQQLAVFPEQFHADYQLEGLTLTKKDREQINFSNAQLSANSEAQNFKFGMETDVDYQNQKNPKKDIKNGHGKLDWNFTLPWSEMIAIARRNVADPKNQDSLLRAFVQKIVGTDVQLKLDLGENYFGLNLNSDVKIPLGNALNAYLQKPKTGSTPKDSDYLRQIGQFDKLGDVLARQLGLQGEWNFFAEIQNYEKFISRTHLFPPDKADELREYADSSSDENNLKFNISYKNRKALLNGKPNETIQKVFDKMAGTNTPAKKNKR